jgi:hypothetical protein
MELLRLMALDGEDLAVVSAHLQDAVVKLSDASYLPKEQRFALVARRFEWECEDPQPRRRLTGVHFDRVTHVRCRNIDRSRPNEALSLLAITFEKKLSPSGTVTLIFSGDAAIQLDVECIEIQMKDLGPVWAAVGRPIHDAAGVT